MKWQFMAKKSKVKLLDRTEIVILWGVVKCPYCGREVHVCSDDDEVKCANSKCRKQFKLEWE
jgi:hypothetical protein